MQFYKVKNYKIWKYGKRKSTIYSRKLKLDRVYIAASVFAYRYNTTARSYYMK